VWTDLRLDKIRYRTVVVIISLWQEREGMWLGSHMTW